MGLSSSYPLDLEEAMSVSRTPGFNTPANNFLHSEVYRLSTEPGLGRLPQSADRDFVTMTWGPIVFQTTYAPESQEMLRVFLRALNEEIHKVLPQVLDGSPRQIDMLQQTYASKVFSDQGAYENATEEAIRAAFHDWKCSFAQRAFSLPSRLKFCLIVDDVVLENFTAAVNHGMLTGNDAGVSSCPIKMVEEQYPDNEQQQQQQQASNAWWTSVTLGALLEVYNSMRQGCRLSVFHRDGHIYLGNGQWAEETSHGREWPV